MNHLSAKSDCMQFKVVLLLTCQGLLHSLDTNGRDMFEQYVTNSGDCPLIPDVTVFI